MSTSRRLIVTNLRDCARPVTLRTRRDRLSRLAPIACPVLAPIGRPVLAPIACPVLAPIARPVLAPIACPVLAPIARRAQRRQKGPRPLE
jgi:hypothetical protein